MLSFGKWKERTKAGKPSGIKIYNSLMRRKEEFIPLRENEVRMYSCGPTVYDYFHIGNARPFIFFDVVRRYLEYKGYVVTYVQNITDIDDKIINRALATGRTPHQVAEKFTQAFFEDSDALGIRRATLHPKATNHIQEMIHLILRLLKRGYAYILDSDVYFDVTKFKSYGILSGSGREEGLEEGTRIGIDRRKRNPKDFVLWKSAKPDEPWWESPWGK